MPSNMSPLPYPNGRPPGATQRAGYSSTNGGLGISNGASSSSSAPGGSKYLSSLLVPSDGASDAVLEKHRLANRGRLPGPLGRWFSPYPVPLPGTTRRLLVPLPNLVHPHPHPASPIIPPHYRSNHPRHHGFQSRKKQRSLRTTLLYGLGVVAIVLLLFSRIRSAIRNSAKSIPLPFQAPSTLILDDEAIRRLWEWEISAGHYPSSRRLPTVVHLDRVGNPGLPSKGKGPQLGDAHPERRVLPKGQLRAPSAFLDDIVPIGPQRSYLNISQPAPFAHGKGPSAYAPRPVPNTVLDLDVVMDYCDFATNQYVRDCHEILRLGGGLDPGKRVRRGDASRWRHIYSEQVEQDEDDDLDDDARWEGRKAHDAARRKSGDDELSEDAMRSAGYRPEDVLGQVKSDGYPERLRGLKRAKDDLVDVPMVDRLPHPTHPTADPTCDPDYPRLFHIFWAGPFTDKPYLAVLSFLFTQNLGLDLPLNGEGDAEASQRKEDFLKRVCRPQIWVWINPGPAAAVPNPNARREMLDDLSKNPWSAPFLHRRFAEVVKFKMWNTTEQLDGVPELRDHWRALPLFNSGGVKYGGAGPAASNKVQEKKEAEVVTKGPVTLGKTVAPEDAKKRANPEGGPDEVPDVVEEELGRFGNHTKGEEAIAEDMTATKIAPTGPSDTSNATSPSQAPAKKSEDELFDRVGSTAKRYDRLSVILSDMARFVLCHRFGGVYLDADTILLRDWEELWGWKGQFAYRWSRLEKYNTAVLKLHRHSATGSFLFHTALANSLDFHPMTISKYTKDAYVEGLLLRLPDALFDPAWLNVEYYQRDRPAFPYFKRFEDFFDPPKEDHGGPAPVGFDGFFRGAFSYHFHNFWWIPFDPSRNFPDLGPRFAQGERVARAKALAAKIAKSTAGASPSSSAGAVPGQAGTGAQAAPLSPGRRAQSARELEAELARTVQLDQDDATEDERDLPWATVLKRTFESFARGERPSMYGEWLDWGD